MFRAKDNLIVIIPAYEPPKEFIEYAKQVAEFSKELVVVNDGSGLEYEPVFYEISRLPNVRYITYAQNHGKGYALKQAFRYCAESFKDSDIIVTADCDGQHKSSDIIRVFEASYAHPNALILGSRDFTLPNIPPRSRFGNAFIRKLFHLLYGLNVYDTQTGLRGFSVALAQRYGEVKGDRFEYEMGVLTYSQKNGIPVSEIPIATIYPDDPSDHVTHFKAISDSLKTVGILFKSLNWYVISSALSGALDVLIFFLLSGVILKDVSAVNTLIATVIARTSSSLLNFSLNRKYVFEGKSKKSIYRYYILWFFQMGVSYGLVFLFGNIIGLSLTGIKIVIDLTLAFFSYQIQRHWVFKNDLTGEFYGPAVSIVRMFARLFSKKYRCNVLSFDEGAVYVCRHLDMHGPYTTIKWLNFHVHPMIFSPFFTRRDCYKHYSEYTFTERRGKKKGKFNLKAFISSRFVPIVINSLKAIPVYRGSAETVRTFRSAMKHLKNNESVIVYPDIDYTAGADKISDIYDGFLLLGQLYKRQTGKSLKFVPIYIDENKRTVNEYPYITVDNFNEDREEAVKYLVAAINGKAPEKIASKV